jgi:hypothetical protein
MRTFRLSEEGAGQVEYCVLRCPVCGGIFRHDVGANSFGKAVRNRMCLVCGAKVPIDDAHCLDQDPMSGQYASGFKSAKDI